MSHIVQLRQDVESKIAQLHPSCSLDDIKEYFELSQNHVISTLSRIRNAKLLAEDTLANEFINFILTNTDTLMNDLTLIESCGLNRSFNNPSRYMYAVNALAIRADNLYRQSSFSNYLRYTLLGKRPHAELLKDKAEFNYAENIDELA